MKRVIMIMGVQRSGTNILFSSLFSGCKSCYNENSPLIFNNFLLKPYDEVEAVLQESEDPILMKPISESTSQDITKLIEEYNRNYDVIVPCIYRDPVNVYFSWFCEWGVASYDAFLRQYKYRYENMLRAQAKFPSKIAIVKYESLTQGREVWSALTHWLGLSAESKFRADSNGGYRNFRRKSFVERLIDDTKEVYDKIEKAATFK